MTKVERLRQWCDANEPFVRFIEVGIVAFVGIWFSYKQAQIAENSLDVAAAGQKVSEAELKLVDLQTQLANRQFAPEFRFHSKQDDDVPCVGAKDVANRARTLDGNAKLYIETKGASGQPRRILIEGFYYNLHSEPKEIGEEINFYYHWQLYGTAWHSMLIYVPNPLEGKVPLKALGNSVWRRAIAYTYMELTFIDAANQRQTERWRMQFPDSSEIPLSSEPTYDRLVNLEEFFDPSAKEGHVESDITRLVKHVQQLVDELRLEK